MLEKLLRLEKAVDARVDERLRSLMAAALADPEVDEGGKSLAGFILQRLTPTEEVKA